MATYTPKELIIDTENRRYKVRINDKNICLIELDSNGNEDLEIIELSTVFIPIEDWNSVKTFIQKNI